MRSRGKAIALPSAPRGLLAQSIGKVLGVVAIGTILSALWATWLGPLLSQRAAIRFFEAKGCWFLYEGQSKLIGKLFLQEPAMLFSGEELNDNDLVQLHSIPGLRYLLLPSTVTGAGLQHLGRVRRLEILWFENPAIEDNDLVHLKILRNLHSLNVSGASIRGPGLLYLRDLSRLKFLDLSHTKINDEALSFLGDLEALELLAVNSTAVTDSGLEAIGRLRHLREIDIEDTQITSTGQESLRASRPTLQVWNQNPRLGMHIWNRLPLWEDVLGPKLEQLAPIRH